MSKDQDNVKADGSVKPVEPESASPDDAAGANAAAAGKERKSRARGARTVSAGMAHVRSTFNNTVVTITDMKGAVLGWSSSGRMGFKGARKSTAYAATVVAQDAARQVQPYRMQEIEVRVHGPGAGRESAIRALQASGLNISLIRDTTPVPHNGCRPRKRRRV